MISETGVNRDVSKIISGSNARTYTFLWTVAEVQPEAFDGIETLWSVRPNEGLETLREDAFAHSGLRSFTAPSSLKRIEDGAFAYCKNLRHVNLNASILRPEDG